MGKRRSWQRKLRRKERETALQIKQLKARDEETLSHGKCRRDVLQIEGHRGHHWKEETSGLLKAEGTVRSMGGVYPSKLSKIKEGNQAMEGKCG